MTQYDTTTDDDGQAEQYWTDIISDQEGQSVGQLASNLAEYESISIDEACGRIEDAIDSGYLVENKDDGTFGGLFPAEGGDADDRDERPPQTVEAGDVKNKVDLDTTSGVDQWGDIDQHTIDAGVWSPARKQRQQWMGRKGEKAPYAPWADENAPVACSNADHDGEDVTCAECSHHAGYKWGSEGSTKYVHTDYQTAAEWAEMDPRLSGDLVYIQQEDDPYGFVDGDDVRCPETGDWHPAFLSLLEHLGLTYADVSTSGSGVHAVYEGEIPIEGQGQYSWQLGDEPWGANEQPPTIEIYANKHVCIATGDHVPGSGTEVTEWDHDALETILRANGCEESTTHDTDRERPDLDDHTPTVTSAEETTSDIKDQSITSG